ncbi:hypothetical protein FPV67DRAFT_1461870 [Lyophyllum atratum]|nr:hypothetical protein FPV67DRAFT_1461870 [Lyophyllum atratum]
MPSDANSDDTSSAAHSPMPADDESRSQQVRMLERSIQIFAAGVLLGLDDIVFKAIDNIKRWGLHLEGGAFERLLKFLLYDSEEMRSDKALSSPHWTFTDGLLEEAIDLFAHSIPDGFKIDFRAPHSKFLSRFGTGDHPPPSAVSTPAVSAANQHQRMIRQIQSTVLLSIPFDVMKQILEHNALARNGRRRAFELSSAVIQERERRRKRELKAHQDQQQGGGERKNPSENGSEIIDRADTYPDVLCWEESAVSTFGHGGIGIEIARRKKGGPGGRMLWKVGTRAGASH